MSPPTPATLRDTAAQIERLAYKVYDDYAWLHASGYQRDSSSDRAGGSGQRLDEGGPTASVVHGRDAVRRRLERVARQMGKAMAELHGAAAAIEAISTIIDEGCEHTPSDHDTKIPRIVTRSELHDARKAGLRREARGERYGT